MPDESVSKNPPEHKAGRTAVPLPIQREVLIEAGYRCAVPTCRTILAIDLHHLEEVADGGSNAPSNLIALCPTCHALYHRGTIHRDALYSWKSILVALGQAFDREAIDALQFLARLRRNELGVSGDGVLRFSRLISAGLADFRLMLQNGPLVMYEVFLTAYGKLLIEAWKSGNRGQVEAAMKMQQSAGGSECG